ncbi:MAG: hypothetical protein GX101_00050 [Firmicutes bacterium]|jgi:N-acetylmuramoyl-L-alanine amidase|nr:cell wall hydrolase [Bacillota bacterium]NLO65065.1 hypothetical protein [Bacillota bacterium]
MGKKGLRAALGVLLILVISFTGIWYLQRQGLIGSEPKGAEQDLAQELSSWRDTISPADLDLLARVVRAESQGEPFEGQVAVAAVILNRVNHPEFPNTIPGVVYEPRAFTVVSNGTVNQPADETALEAAHAALNGLDPTGGALFFYNPNKTGDQWIRTRTVLKKIGDHVFAS